jgi:hypothetical protein
MEYKGISSAVAKASPYAKATEDKMARQVEYQGYGQMTRYKSQ